MHGAASLIPSAVLSARFEYAAGGVTQEDLAFKYRVSQATMGQLLRGETWREVGGPFVVMGAGRSRKLCNPMAVRRRGQSIPP